MTLAFIAILLPVTGQDAKQYYDEAIELVQQDKPQEAISFFDKSIALNPDEYVAWYNRGIAKTMLHRYEEALPDFTHTIQLRPDYKKAYLNRANTRKHLTDYSGATDDYYRAIAADSAYAQAYYELGVLYNLLSQRDSACFNYERALKLGYKNAQRKMQRCTENPTLDKNLHPILRLSRIASSATYGLTEADPVKVGMGPEGGPDNQRSYLDLLRSPDGGPIRYQRLGSCCAYNSANALIGGVAMLDQYQISYTDSTGAETKKVVYITFYDYEEPLILSGFKTVGM